LTANDGKSAISIAVETAKKRVSWFFVEPPVRIELTTARLPTRSFRELPPTGRTDRAGSHLRGLESARSSDGSTSS
jgi:hypothetical protein